ncbi:hypothetical protein H6P81_007784 [Aristolochia fimbriata]|uniref:Uncharacterized protein n=1 Tax=Aristolochia fimbriata TaxID=158543 RepID=A0AAV7F180_ARIFI|nr:hypothetical protein H6P81_007784 [Aristolochia fimbriata]
MYGLLGESDPVKSFRAKDKKPSNPLNKRSIQEWKVSFQFRDLDVGGAVEAATSKVLVARENRIRLGIKGIKGIKKAAGVGRGKLAEATSMIMAEVGKLWETVGNCEKLWKLFSASDLKLILSGQIHPENKLKIPAACEEWPGTAGEPGRLPDYYGKRVRLVGPNKRTAEIARPRPPQEECETHKSTRAQTKKKRKKKRNKKNLLTPSYRPREKIHPSGSTLSGWGGIRTRVPLPLVRGKATPRVPSEDGPFWTFLVGRTARRMAQQNRLSALVTPA